MNKKVVLGIIILVIIVAVIAGVYFLVIGNKEKEVTIDLQALNATLSQQTPFNEMSTTDITMQTLQNMYEITTEEVDEVIGKMPMMNVQASMYLVIKAKPDKLDSVKTKVDNYAKAYEEQWAMYLPEQYELVKQRKTGAKGDYVYLIISENASELETLIK